MRFIGPAVHGTLDYSVALALVGIPPLLDFAESSVPAALVSVAGGLGLFVYSLLTDYSAGLRRLIPFRLHLAFDAVAAGALLASPFLFGFAGIARGFYLIVGVAVLAVVACTRPEPAPATGEPPRADASRATA